MAGKIKNYLLGGVVLGAVSLTFGALAFNESSKISDIQKVSRERMSLMRNVVLYAAAEYGRHSTFQPSSSIEDLTKGDEYIRAKSYQLYGSDAYHSGRLTLEMIGLDVVSDIDGEEQVEKMRLFYFLNTFLFATPAMSLLIHPFILRRDKEQLRHMKKELYEMLQE